jgi:hypothetical protein
MVATRIPLWSVSVIMRSVNFSPASVGMVLAVAGLAEAAGAGTFVPAVERDDIAGEPAVAPEEPAFAAGALAALPAAPAPADGNTSAALGAALFGFTGRPAACLHRSDSASLWSLRQAAIRPPPAGTPTHSLCTSSAQAARIAPSEGWVFACADRMAEAVHITSSSVKLLMANLS